MSYNYLPLDRKWLSFQQVKNLLDYDQLVSITFDAHERILKCRKYLDSKQVGLSNGESLSEKQYKLLQNKPTTVGEEVPLDIVKLMLMLKIKSLSFGHSGVQIETVKRLMEMYNNRVFPVVYSQSFSSAGGDVALSHISLPLAGAGKVYYNGEQKTSGEVLRELGWEPIHLQDQESFALMTGTQFTTAHGMYALKQAEQLLWIADLIAALSLDACNYGIEPLHERIQSVKNHKGQVETAAFIAKCLQGTEPQQAGPHELEIPYSFQCIPQVHGSAKDTFEYVLSLFLKEINSVTENPVIFPDEDLILSGGNFQAQPLQLALDFLKMAISSVAKMSERRIHRLLSGERDLPKYLVTDAAVSPGFKTLQATASVIIAEIRQLSVPGSLNNISANDIEDFVSPGGQITECLRVIKNAREVLAIELISAARAFELRGTGKTSAFLEQVLFVFHESVTVGGQDMDVQRVLSKAIDFVDQYKVE